MFFIHTATATQRHHTLSPVGGLRSIDPDLANVYDLHIELRISVGATEPYKFKIMLGDVDGVNEPLQLVTLPSQLRVAAAMHDQEFDSETVYAVAEDSAVWLGAQRLIDHFRAMMKLELFRLPATY